VSNDGHIERLLKESYAQGVESHFDSSDKVIDMLGPIDTTPIKPQRFRRLRAAWRRIADAWGVLTGKYEAYAPEHWMED